MIHSDNTGSEVRLISVGGSFPVFVSSVQRQAAVRRGTARSLDHAQLVYQQWLQIVNLRISVYIKRVATDVNIADLPSRNVRFS